MNHTRLTQADVSFNSAVVATEAAKHSSAEAMIQAGLDWQVEKRLIQYNLTDGGIRSFPNQYVLTRLDNESPLSVVGKDYQSIQNVDAFDMFDNLTFIGGMAEYIRAGCTKEGQKIFIEAKLTGDNIRIKQGDEIEKRIYLWNSHGGDSFKIFFVPFRLTCQNQLTGMFTANVYKQNTNSKKEVTGVRIIHKGNVRNKMDEAQKIINQAIIHFEAAQAVFQYMEAKDVSETQAKTFYKLLTLTKGETNGEVTSTRVHNQREEMLTLFKSGKGNRGKTLWDAYNGATEWSDHKRSLKHDTEKEENRFFGSGKSFKQRALTLATETVHGKELLLPNGMPLVKLKT